LYKFCHNRPTTAVGNGTLVGLQAYLVGAERSGATAVFRLCRSDHISRIIVSLHFWLRCTKGLFSRSPCRLIELSMAMMPRSTYGSSHRSPTSRLDKDCGFLHPKRSMAILVPAVRLPTVGRCAFLVAGAHTKNV